jgi:hypothetical protein
MENPVPATLATDPVLARFRAALDALYGGRIERVVLLEFAMPYRRCVCGNSDHCGSR